MKHWSDRMNRVVLVASCAFALGGFKAAPAAQKVTICHFPPGNPANVQIITVGQAAVAAHITKHNDAVCSAGATNCCFGGSSPSICTNFETDVDNCGACGTVCPAGDVCDSGTCQCPTAGQTNCSGTCTDTSTDANNCGSCGNVCSTGDTCTGGTCVSPCPPGDITCQGQCVDPNTDPNNCGACGTQCSTGDVCATGNCCIPAGADLPGGCNPTTVLSCCGQICCVPRGVCCTVSSGELDCGGPCQ
jgi:hypothetical protein